MFADNVDYSEIPYTSRSRLETVASHVGVALAAPAVTTALCGRGDRRSADDGGGADTGAAAIRQDFGKPAEVRWSVGRSAAGVAPPGSRPAASRSACPGPRWVRP